MSFRHSSRVKLVVVPLALLALTADPAFAQGNKPNPPSVTVSFTSNSVTFTFGSVTGATSYDVQISDKQNMSNVVGSGSTSEASVPVTVTGLQSSTKYYYEATVTVSGRTSNPSRGNFTTLAPPGPPPPQPPLAPTNLQMSAVTATSVTLGWSVISGATSYAFEVATDGGFKLKDIVASGITGTATTTVRNLQSSTQYFWHVRATTSSGTSEFSQAGSFHTLSAALAPPELRNPDNNARNISTTVEFQWMGSAGATTYTLQYSVESKFGDNVVETSGISKTSHQVAGLQPMQTYYWRVLAIGLSGTSDWSSVYSFTTGSSPLFTPQLVSPDDKAKNVPTSATLQWADVGGARWYVVQYSTDRKFVNNVLTVDSITVSLVELTGLLPNITYYWRVQAKDPTNSSAWSAEWEFATGSHRLAVPVLLQPEDKAKDIPTNMSFEWNKADGASAYDLQYSTDRNFRSEVVIVESIDQLSYPATKLQQNTTYYWRVRAKDSVGAGDWSPDREFKTGSSSLAAPHPRTPEDGAKGVSTNPSLSWGIVSGAESYDVQVSLKNKVVLDTTGVVAASLDLGGLLPNETYSWKVQANAGTDTSPWSPESKFTTGSSVLATPTLLSPSDGRTGESTTPMLSWTVSAGSSTAATYYTVQYAKDRNFNKELVEISGISTSSCTLGDLATQETYFWRVRAYDWTDSSDWTEAWSFKTGSGRLGAPMLLSPVDKSDAPLNPTLKWTSSVGATSYSVQVWQPQHSGTFIVDVSNLPSTSLTVLDLVDKQKYSWRVRAISPQDSSDWTPEWSFSVSSSVTDVEEIGQVLPAGFKLSQNYPNPFNPMTTIEFSLPTSSHVKILIYSTLGRLVHTLVDEDLPPGSYRKQWVATGLPSGVYFSRIRAGNFTDVKRLLLVK